MQASFTSIMEQHPDFSGVVYIRQDGKLVFGQAFGYANRADQRPNTVDTRFGIASGNKVLTGVAICQLIEQGKLSFDSRLPDIVDADFPHFDPTITVRHLLTHTSGVPDYFDEDEQTDYGALWLERPTYTIRTPRDFLPLFQHKPMKFKPGERFHYNNGGFILLGLIIEAASGQTYIDYVTQHILQPAGMSQSGFFPMDFLPANTALGYLDDGRTNIFSIPIIGGADGGMMVTAPDMGCFWDALLGHRLLSPEMTAQLLQPHITVNPENSSSYGYGIWMFREGDRVTRWHAEGADPGVSFRSTRFRQQPLEITVISNTGDGVWDVFKNLIANFSK